MKQIVIQPQAVGFCCFHQRIDDCTRFRTLGCIGKEPFLPANDKRADGVFYLVVADFNLTMLKKRAEVRLLILSISSVVISASSVQPNPSSPHVGLWVGTTQFRSASDSLQKGAELFFSAPNRLFFFHLLFISPMNMLFRGVAPPLHNLEN